jgi:acyl carrier protein
MSTNSFNYAVRQFITRQFSHARTRALADGDPLLESGIVDSLGVLDLVTFIESEFGVSVADEELIPEHFNSIDRIAAYIQSKQRETGAPTSR